MPDKLPFATRRSEAIARGIFAYGIELTAVVVAAVTAFLLRFDFSIPAIYIPILTVAILVWGPAKLASFKFLGLDRRWARYASMSDLMRVAASNLLGSFLGFLILMILRTPVPRSIYAIDLLLCVMITAGLRVTVRLLTDLARPTPVSGNTTRRTIIYGAGNAGASLQRDIQQNPGLPYKVIGFIDDDPRKRGLILQGITVLGTGTELSQIAKNQQADLILIAVPSASGGQMRRIFESCTAAGVPYKTIPGLAEMMEEGGLAGQIRDVAVEDLLGRTPANLEHERISSTLRDQVVLVTGAAGSIGSEICRQIARFGPKLIIGYDIAESPMFYLEQELRRLHPGLAFHPELGSIQNTQRLRETFTAFAPTVVYHAAAYKHVPLMEAHAFEAIENNVFGTLNVVQAARHFGVREFVMISSDKAVRPANVMGATKRMAELVVRSLQPEDGRYVSVRFGNVLGGNGSVVPIFKDQIARGGPVTVTHPEMSRYFMTIPEACQLVLQASTMGRGGEIFVLDMGEPVKIVDLARNLILLSGLRPDVDLRIEFTGTRPGEKLAEELSVLEEGLLTTHHEKIRVFSGLSPDWDTLAKSLNILRGACSARILMDLICGMREIVPAYRPSEELSARAYASREPASRETASSEAA